jgi:hypothetical protein
MGGNTLQAIDVCGSAGCLFVINAAIAGRAKGQGGRRAGLNPLTV